MHYYTTCGLWIILTHVPPLLDVVFHQHIPITVILVILLCNSFFFFFFLMLRLVSLFFTSDSGVFKPLHVFRQKRNSLLDQMSFKSLWFLWISLITLILEAAEAIWLSGWHNGSLTCGSRGLGSIWSTQTSPVWHFWFCCSKKFWTGRSASQLFGCLKQSVSFFTIVFMILILKAAEVIVLLGWPNGSLTFVSWGLRSVGSIKLSLVWCTGSQWKLLTWISLVSHFHRLDLFPATAWSD